MAGPIFIGHEWLPNAANLTLLGVPTTPAEIVVVEAEGPRSDDVRVVAGHARPAIADTGAR